MTCEEGLYKYIRYIISQTGIYIYNTLAYNTS